jgi:hypothetical protein
MPLPLPNLDTRRWADLLAEGQALIPRYATGWTDHNLHDPGIMLIELLAWQAEQAIYRANRVSESARRSFLDLIGYPPLPARPARGVLCCPTGPGRIPAGLLLEAAARDGRALPFRTLAELTPVESRLIALLSDDGEQIGDVTRSWRDGHPVAAFGPNPRLLARTHRVAPGETSLSIAGTYGAVAEEIVALNRLADLALALVPGRVLQIPPATALYLGLDRPLPAGAQLCLWVELADERFSTLHHARWRDELSAQRDACRRLTPAAHPCPPGATDRWDSDAPAPVEEPVAVPSPRHHGPRLTWEIYDADGQRWRAFGPDDVFDETEGLVFTGMLRLRLPVALGHTIIGGVDAHFLRCRLAEGQYDTAPLIRSLLLNAVPVEQSVPYTAVEIGKGNGLPLQQLPLPGGQIVDGAVRLRLSTTDNGEAWEQRANLAHAGRADAVFALSPIERAICFGDGERGRVAPAGAAVQASYLATAGAGGALDAGAAWRLSAAHADANRSLLGLAEDAPLPDLSLIGPLPTVGGVDAEEATAAATRALGDLLAHERLVELAAGPATLDQIDRAAILGCAPPARALTLLDYERLALETPGAAVARARAWANLDPSYPGRNALGTVALVIVPELPLGRPQPSPGLLGAVRCYLERRRVVGTRLVITGPSYVAVSVTASIRLLPAADPSRVRTTVMSAIDQLLDPLRGGPVGRGWPFGRDVYRAEIMALIDQVPGVDYIQALELRADDGTAQCGNLCIGPLMLASPGTHSIEVI